MIEGIQNKYKIEAVNHNGFYFYPDFKKYLSD